jgi:hypothetical protein
MRDIHIMSGGADLVQFKIVATVQLATPLQKELGNARAQIQLGSAKGNVLGVAEAGADGNLVPPFGAPAAKHSRARLGLHPGQKPVSLGAVAAVGLKGTLRHFTRLLLNLFVVCNSLPVYLKALPRFALQQRKGFSSGPKYGLHATIKVDFLDVSIELHKEWCNAIFYSQIA